MSECTIDGLDRDACLALVAGRSFGRLIFTQRALPDVLPVSYRLDGQNVLIRLASSSAAAGAASHDAVVAFEIDDYEALSERGWTVTIVGRAHEITNLDDRLRLATQDLTSWAQDDKDHILSVTVEKISGHRFQGRT